MRKRFLALLLSLCMLFSLLPVTALAVEDGQLIDGPAMFYYRIDSSNLAKMLVANEKNADAEIEDITIAFDNGYETTVDTSTLRTRTLSHLASMGRRPTDIAQLIIKLAGDQGTVSIEGNALTWSSSDKVGNRYYSLRLINQPEVCTVTFRYKPVGSAIWYDYTYKTVEAGTPLGDTMPAEPPVGSQHFVGWNTKDDGTGKYFSADTVVDSDMTVYAIKVTAGGATAYHVINGTEDWLQKEVLEKENSEEYASDVRITTIRVNGDQKTTNPNYFRNGWRSYSSTDAYHYYIYNVWAAGGTEYWNNDISVEDITGITLTGTIADEDFTVTIPREKLAFKTVSGAGTDVIVEIWLAEALYGQGQTITYPVVGTIDHGIVTNGNQDVEKDKPSEPMTFTPSEGYAISSVTVNGENVEFNLEENGSYIHPAQDVNDSITVAVTTKKLPTEPTYEELAVILGDGAVRVECSSLPAEHIPLDFSLIEKSYESDWTEGSITAPSPCRAGPILRHIAARMAWANPTRWMATVPGPSP